MITIINKEICLQYEIGNFQTEDKFFCIHDFIHDLSFNGSSFSKSTQQCLSTAISEYYERIALYTINKDIQNMYKAYSLLDKNIISLDKDTIKRKKLMNDSSGMACHTDANLCLKNALMEFIERQSFVFNYLSKSEGFEIIELEFLKNIHNEELRENIRFYNISIIDSVYVIIGLGIANNNYYTGLGTDCDFRLAINKCIKEINQMDRVFLYNKNRSRHNKKLDYDDLYLSLPYDKLKSAYSYLTNSKFKIIDPKIYEYKLEDIVLEMNEKCNMNPLVVFHKRINNQNIKIMHIIDLNWFPSLSPLNYSEDNYSFVEKVMKSKLDRRCNFIPFA